jgi:hypothetical protein
MQNMNIFSLIMNLSSSDVASWVQAFGSIIGIGIAIVVPMHQRKKERQEKNQEKKELESMHAKNISIISEELYFYAKTARELAEDNCENIQRHYPELMQRICRLRDIDTRIILNVILKNLNSKAWLMEVYINQTSQRFCSFDERIKEYRVFEDYFMEIKINAHTTYKTLRDSAKNSAR